MAWTQANLDALEAAIIQAAVAGFVEANYDGRGMRRYTLKELLDLREAVKAVVSGAAGGIRCTYAEFSKG